MPVNSQTPTPPSGRLPDCVLREVDPTSEVDTRWAAQLHRELFAEIGLIAQLGERVLQRFCYGRLIEDGLMRAVLAVVDQKPAGLLAFTTDTRAVHQAPLGSHLGVALRELLVATLVEPRILLKIPNAVRLILERRNERVPQGGPVAEVLAFGVRRQYRGRKFVAASGIRLNDMLLRYALAAAKTAGVREGRGVVLKSNRPVVMYGCMRASRVSPYTNAAKESVEIWYDVDEALRLIDQRPPAR